MVFYEVIYQIMYRDRAQFDAAQALWGGNVLWGVPPQQAASLFALPYPDPDPNTTLNSLGRCMLHAAGFNYDVNPPGTVIHFPLSSGIRMDPTVPTTIVPGQFGGDEGSFTWVLIFIFSGGGTGTVPDAPIPPRRWICGAELPQNGEGASTVSGIFGNLVSRDASRTIEGFGFALRDADVGEGSLTYTVQGLGQPASPDSWERIYLRSRVRPTSATTFWQCFGTVQPLSGLRIDQTAAGALAINRLNSGGAATLLATVGTIPPYPSWGRYDFLINFRDGADQGRFRIYENGVLILDAVIPNDGQGLGVDQDHASSRLGNPGATGNDMELDIDDWHNAEIPNLAGSEALTSRDWNNGSHIAKLTPDGFAATSSVSWAGNWRVLLQNYLQLTQVAFLQAVTSSTALALLGVTTRLPPAWLEQLGGAAMVTGLFSLRTSVDGQLGCTVPAVGSVLSPITQNTLAIWNSVLLNLPASTLEPMDFVGAELFYEKGNSGTAASAYCLQGAVEFIGAYGEEDNPDGTLPPPLRQVGIHNAPYPGSRWVQEITNQLDNPVLVAGGIYVGNNLGQDVLQTMLPHWWLVRPLTGNAGGTRWWTSMVASHRGLQTSPTPSLMADATQDIATSINAGMLRIAGADAQANANPVAYQWIAIMDPAMRYVINGALAANSNVASRTTSLVDPVFTPDLVTLQVETPGSTTTNRFYYRGPGFGSADASQLDGTIVANAVQLGVGNFTTQTVIHNAAATQVAYSAMRAVDPNACTDDIVLAIGTYVGDGVNPRTLAIDLGGRWPLLALIVPASGAGIAYLRDPSHTGSDSSAATLTGSVVTTAITGGGVDQLTVGTLLNTLGVTYSYFLIPGDPTGWNNGTFVLAPSCGDVPCPPYCCDCVVDEPPPIPPEDCVDDWGTARADGLPYVPLMPED